jgi:hypothetical protein
MIFTHMLKPYLIAIPALLLSLVSVAQTVNERKLEPFHKVVAGDKIIVQLIKSDHESAQVKVQGIDASRVKTEVSGGTLTLSIYGEQFTKKKVMVTVNYRDIQSITVNNGSEVSTGNLFKADTLRADLKSGGVLYLDLDIGCLIARITEGGLLSAEGYATSQEVTVASLSTHSAFDLESDKVKIKAVTGGKAKINVEEELEAEASSNGYISYKGTPAILKKTANSGGSIVVYKP